MGNQDQGSDSSRAFDPNSQIESGFEVTTNRGRIDVDRVHRFLSRSYWAAGCTREQVAKALDGSKCFAIFWRKEPVAFGRVITDYATFAYVSDVCIEADFRGRGLSQI